MIRLVWLAVLMLALASSGCSKNRAAPAPGHAPNDNSGTAGNPNSAPNKGADPASPGGNTAGGTAGGAPAPSNGSANNGGAAAKKPENLATITRDQYDKLTGQMTYDQVVKLLGNPGKLVADTGDKKTYQFQLKDDPKYYVNISFNKGNFSEKSIFTM